jgi:phenylalanyl-tRNA synthetase beta chain
MKVSLNWVKEFTPVELPVDEVVRKIGAQLGEVEGVENIGPKYDKAVVVKVVTCEKHPNADRLNVCSIDDGGITPDVMRDENGLVTVVCGAPNVTAGVTVVWLPPGATVPESYGKEPFVLDARELRGVVSNGMLASPKELALGDSHEGLLLLEDDKLPGTPFASAYSLDDYIIDIENKMFTHRPDLFGELGIAREIAGITGQQFVSPHWYRTLEDSPLSRSDTDLPLAIHNELPALVPRFMAVALSDISIHPSPVWLQTKLARVGVRPINNVVDITNYMMVLSGQPLHAYDYDKVKALSGQGAAILTARNPRESEKITLLNGKTVDPRQDGIMIATDTQLIGIGGVMGGADTEVDASTQRVILEVATFDMYSVRKTSMAHGLFTDAVTRFNKGQSPLQNPYILRESLALLGQLAGARQASDILDDDHTEGRTSVHPTVPVATSFINARLGFNLSADDMRTLLQNVEFDVSTDGDTLHVTPPFWRTDIETREDVVEEVGRLYGFDKLPLVLPSRSVAPVTQNSLLELRAHIREVLSKAGANEVLTYSFVHGHLFRKVGQHQAHAFTLSNALSPDLQYYRTTLTPSLLDKVHMNVKSGYDKFALFELGKVHYQDEWEPDETTLPLEDNHLALVVAYDGKAQPQGAPYYQARQLLEQVIGARVQDIIPVHDLDLASDEWGQNLVAPYEPNRTGVVIKDGRIWGVIGEFRAQARKSLKLPPYTAGFEINLGIVDKPSQAYQPLPRFPKVSQDVTLRVNSALHYGVLAKAFEGALNSLKPEQTKLEMRPLSIYKKEDGYQQVSFRLLLANYQRTMTDEEVSQLIENAVNDMRQSFDVSRI